MNGPDPSEPPAARARSVRAARVRGGTRPRKATVRERVPSPRPSGTAFGVDEARRGARGAARASAWMVPAPRRRHFDSPVVRAALGLEGSPQFRQSTGLPARNSAEADRAPVEEELQTRGTGPIGQESSRLSGRGFSSGAASLGSASRLGRGSETKGRSSLTVSCPSRSRRSRSATDARFAP